MTEDGTETNNGGTNSPIVPENIHLKLEQIPPPSAPPDFFQDLAVQTIDTENKITKRDDLYRRLQLKKALTVSKIQSEDEDWVISKAFKEAISWGPDDKNPDHPNWIVPRKKAFFTVDVQKSLVAHQVGKFFSKGSSSQELSLFGSLNSDSEGESFESSSLSSTSKSYLLAEYTIPKVILSIDWDNIGLVDYFKTKVNTALSDNEWSGFVKLNYLLNEYGYFVPLKFMIGGKISAQSEVSSQIDSNSKQYSSFQSSFASSLGLFGAESEASKESESEKMASQNASSQSSMELEYYGGLGSAAINPMGWMMSLNSYVTWTVIKYSELVPIICFFEEDLRNKAIRAFMRYSYYPDTDKPLLLNGISYASLALDLISKRSFFQGDPDTKPLKPTTPFFNQKKPKKFNLLFSYRKNTESPSSDKEDSSQP